MNSSRFRKTLRGRYGAAAALGVAVALPFSLASADRAGPRSTPEAQASSAPGSTARLVAAPSGGSWLVTSNGRVYGVGAARTYGSLAGAHLTSPIAGIVASPTGRG